MKWSKVGWVAVYGVALIALYNYRPVHDVENSTSIVLAQGSGMRDGILDYSLIDVATHKQVTLGSLKGKAKAIYIDIFASWCGPCQALIPEVEALHRKLSAKGVLVLGLNVSDQWDAMRKDVNDRGITYPVLFDDGQAGGILQYLQADLLPTVIVLDGNTLEQKARWVGGDDAGQRDRVFSELGVGG